MHQSNFEFLKDEFDILYNLGQSAEYNLHQDPPVCLMKLRLFIERLTDFLFKEHHLQFPYDNTLHNRLKDLEYEQILGDDRIANILFKVKNLGNKAAHDNKGSIDDAKFSLHSMFTVTKWFYEIYAKAIVPVTGLRFKMPPKEDTRHALSIKEQEYNDLLVKHQKLLEERELEAISKEKKAQIIERTQKAARNIEMSEEMTRVLIDEKLREAGWEVDTKTLNYKTHKTLPQRGKNMAIAEWRVGKLWADYALFIGTTLYGIAEAKKYGKDISSDLTQSKLYAENGNLQTDVQKTAQLLGQWRDYHVPFLYATNGRPYLAQLKEKSGIWFLDVRKERNNSRALQGWHSPEGLKKLYEQDIEQANQQLKDADLVYLQNKSGLSLRNYQIQAIQAVEAHVLREPKERRALLAMATGTGKTRTIMGLCYRLIKSNRFKRILFLVDRTLLALQAFDSFKDTKVEDLNTFSEIYQVQELKDKIPEIDTRLHFATVQGMVKRLFYSENGDKLTVDAYDCIIVDEAHRGYALDRELDEEELKFKNQMDFVSKYRKVLDYFDAFAIGLTATPAQHTSAIFGKPIFNYSYRQAVIEGYLIDHEPPFNIKTKLNQEGMVWKKGEQVKYYDKESNTIIDLAEAEDEIYVDVAGFNKSVLTESFNKTVIEQLIKELDPEDEEKTLIFAARDEHADMVVRLLKEAYREMGADVPDDAITKITGNSYKPRELVRRFKNEKYPNIVVTVDLLTTGIDVPSISNLVFLRQVKSRILYEQMLGRATRLCPDIGKETFKIFDAVSLYDNLQDYTQMKPVVVNPKTSFSQLADEFAMIESPARQTQQVEQVIAKLQRKKQHFHKDNADSGDNAEAFTHLAEGKNPDELIDFLQTSDTEASIEKIVQLGELWKFLDEFKPAPTLQLVSEHQDEYLGTTRGYGDYERPEDYLEGFTRFIEANRNKIDAINLVCTRPKSLDRASLKSLRLELDRAGFSATNLNAAWKDSKNEDIAADIIAYIRTLAMGNPLVSKEERVQNAMKKVRQLRYWTKKQQNWLNRIEKQLLVETIIHKDDLNKEPFASSGGYSRINKIFEEELDLVIETIQEHLFTA